jgi:hypothetical protein
MRFFVITFFYCLLLNLSSCKTTQKTSEEKVLLKVDTLENGFKKLYLLKNKKLEVLTTNGSLSYAIVDNENTNVLQYSYAINQDQTPYDGGYREEIVFEISKSASAQNYLDSELQNTKMLFGRYCNCRGKNGLFKVNQGKLNVVSSSEEFHFELQFKISEVPQVTNSIIY